MVGGAQTSRVPPIATGAVRIRHLARTGRPDGLTMMEIAHRGGHNSPVMRDDIAGPTIASTSVMRMMIAALLLGTGCLGLQETPNTPGDPDLFFESQSYWVQGESNDVAADWSNACAGTGDWFCPSSTMTVEDVSCAGCTVTHDPIHVTANDGVVFGGVATTDGTITMVAQLRFDPTGATAQVSQSVTGDHEVALEATCKLIDNAVLQQYLAGAVPAGMFRDCDTPRGVHDVAVVFPALRTFHGNARFPFCADNPKCVLRNGDPLRLRSALAIAPAPTGWGRSAQIEPAEFAIMPDMATDTDVTLSTPLMPTGVGTATVQIPGAAGAAEN
jgi:hypothetical protein